MLSIFHSDRTKVIDRMIFNYLKRINRKKFSKLDINMPKTLVKNYSLTKEDDKNYINNLLNSFLENEFSFTKWSLCENRYNSIIKRLQEKIKIFHNKPFQLGGLDKEIEVIAMFISQLKSPIVLEIGVANGYSSAVIYSILDIVKGSIVSIDLPKYPIESDYSRVQQYLIDRGLRDETGTIGDLIPGIIPDNKYGGWLIPKRLRHSVDNINLYGDVFNILPKMNNNEYDVIVYDAMKPYQERMKCFRIIKEKLKDGGVCFVDGFWLNNAFIDFCNSNGYHHENFGRVGVFKKSKT